MLSALLDHRRVRQFITLILILCVLICIFPPQEEIFQQIAAYDVHIAATMIGLGLVFLISDKTRLMFVCFGCSAAICFFKNETTLRKDLPTLMPTGSTSFNMVDERLSSEIFDTLKHELTQTLE